MNCKRARIDIALLVGNDLDAPTQQQLERHLANCPHCRDHRHSLTATMQSLQGDPLEPIRTGSLWPRLEQQLARREAAWSGARFNGWVPAMAVAAAWIVLLVFLQSPPPNRHFLESSPMVPTAAGFESAYPASGRPLELLPTERDRDLSEQEIWRRLKQRRPFEVPVTNEF